MLWSKILRKVARRPEKAVRNVPWQADPDARRPVRIAPWIRLDFHSDTLDIMMT